MDSDPIGTPPAEPSPPGSPFARQPEQPRLGIIHLMVWTACTAGCLSIYRVLHLLVFPDKAGELDLSETSQMVSSGIGIGAAWGGLLLFVRRRYRGLPFPVHPGEILLIAIGIHALLSLAWGAIMFSISHAMGWDTASLPWSFWILWTCGNNTIAGLVFLVAALKNKNARWRPFFFSCVALYAVSFFEPWMLWWVSHGFLVFRCLYFVPGLFLLWIVIKDLYRTERYPWTHWLGVGVSFLGDAVQLVRLLAAIVTGDLPL